MLELAADLRLLHEALHDLRILAQVLVQDLDRHVSSEVGVLGLQHDPHPPTGDLSEQLVRAATLG